MELFVGCVEESLFEGEPGVFSVLVVIISDFDACFTFGLDISAVLAVLSCLDGHLFQLELTSLNFLRWKLLFRSRQFRV